MILSYLMRRIFYLQVFVFCFLAQTFSQAERPKIGLVLSGGGAKGIAHVGVLKVIDELGIPVDYVGGTSMGSIVGGLYAIGYDAKTLEDLIVKQDWNNLLADEVTRKNMSVEEKEEHAKYFISFPVQNFKVMLPSGLRAGQNVSLLLSRLALPVHHIDDFSKFCRPFLCVATDMETGGYVVIKNGYLPDAIRASMAIPTIFTPIEIDNKLLVDGGLINNFPAEEVKEMGADILIGVNLGYKMHDKDELNSFTSILEQSLFFQSNEKYMASRDICDILIEPDVGDNGATSFSNAAELISQGEKAARDIYPQLKELAEQMKGFDYKPPQKPLFEIDSIYVSSLEIQGLDKVSKEFLLGKLRLVIPSMISIEDLEVAIERVYGTLFFDMVTYKLEPNGNSVQLIVRVIEKTTNLFRVGAHYDSDFNASLLLNTTFRNALIKGSKFSLDFQLGEYPRFKGSYLINTGWKPRNNLFLTEGYQLGWLPDIGLSVEANKFQIYDYNEGSKSASYLYYQNQIGIFGQSGITNSLLFNAGGRLVHSRIVGEIITSGADIPEDRNRYLNFYGSLKIDSYDRDVYPHSGVQMKIKGEYVRDIGNSDILYDGFTRLSMTSSHALRMAPRGTLIFNYNVGVSLADSVPAEYNFFVGGLNHINFNNNVFPFAGLKFLEASNQNAMMLGLDLQLEPFRDHFVIIRANAAKSTRSYKDFVNDKGIIKGYGFTYGYNSFFGPIEFSVSRGINGQPWHTFINIGYWF